jgi:hypothetical protein
MLWEGELYFNPFGSYKNRDVASVLAAEPVQRGRRLAPGGAVPTPPPAEQAKLKVLCARLKTPAPTPVPPSPPPTLAPTPPPTGAPTPLGAEPTRAPTPAPTPSRRSAMCTVFGKNARRFCAAAGSCAVRSACSQARESQSRYFCDGYQESRKALQACKAVVEADNVLAVKELQSLRAGPAATVWTVGARIQSLRAASAKLQGDAAASVTALSALLDYTSVVTDRGDDGGQMLTEAEGRGMADTLESVVAPGNLRVAAANEPSRAARIALARDVSSRFGSVARLLAASLLRAKSATLNERESAQLEDGALRAEVHGAAGLAIGAVRATRQDMQAAAMARSGRWGIGGGRRERRRRLEGEGEGDADAAAAELQDGAGVDGETAAFDLPAAMFSGLPDDVVLVTVSNPGIYDQEEYEAGAREYFVTGAHGLSVLDGETDTEVTVAGLRADEPIEITLPLLAGLPAAQLLDGGSGEKPPVVTCRYWDKVAGTWAADGCTLAARTAAHVTCNCTHLTEFAVTVGIPDVISEVLDVGAGAPTPFSSPSPSPPPAADAAASGAGLVAGLVVAVLAAVAAAVAVQRRRRARQAGAGQQSTVVLGAVPVFDNPMKAPSDLKRHMQSPHGELNPVMNGMHMSEAIPEEDLEKAVL